VASGPDSFLIPDRRTHRAQEGRRWVPGWARLCPEVEALLAQSDASFGGLN